MTAGLYPGRKEIAVDVLIHIEQIFDKTFFTEAFNSIFDELGPAQAMFGASSELPNVSALLDAASSIVAFDMSFSTGIKVDNAISVFTDGVNATASLFFRLDDLGVFAEATVASVDFDVFPGVTVEGGDFLLSAGVRIASPFEGEVNVGGSMASGITLSHSLTTIEFTPYGQLKASLPFETTINGLTQGLVIKFEDDNLFDTVDTPAARLSRRLTSKQHRVMASVDFPICPNLSVVSGLLGKLGALDLSPRNILGPIETAGLDLADTLDDYFPNLSLFTDGILEGACLLLWQM